MKYHDWDECCSIVRSGACPTTGGNGAFVATHCFTGQLSGNQYFKRCCCLESCFLNVKVVFCTPSLAGPTAPYLKALEDSIPLIKDAGWTEGYAQEIGNAYISSARANLARKALDANAEVIVYLDYDLSWRPGDLLKLIETPGDVFAGTYRCKMPTELYMGHFYTLSDGTPQCRSDGCVKASRVPAGFLKLTRSAIDIFMKAYPELIFGPQSNPSVDLFNHGAHNGVWYGEDFAFSRRWEDAGGEIWVIPDLDIDHHRGSETFKGNFHQYLARLPASA